MFPQASVEKKIAGLKQPKAPLASLLSVGGLWRLTISEERMAFPAAQMLDPDTIFVNVKDATDVPTEALSAYFSVHLAKARAAAEALEPGKPCIYWVQYPDVCLLTASSDADRVVRKTMVDAFLSAFVALPSHLTLVTTLIRYPIFQSEALRNAFYLNDSALSKNLEMLPPETVLQRYGTALEAKAMAMGRVPALFEHEMLERYGVEQTLDRTSIESVLACEWRSYPLVVPEILQQRQVLEHLSEDGILSMGLLFDGVLVKNSSEPERRYALSLLETLGMLKWTCVKKPRFCRRYNPANRNASVFFARQIAGELFESLDTALEHAREIARALFNEDPNGLTANVNYLIDDIRPSENAGDLSLLDVIGCALLAHDLQAKRSDDKTTLRVTLPGGDHELILTDDVRQATLSAPTDGVSRMYLQNPA